MPFALDRAYQMLGSIRDLEPNRNSAAPDFSHANQRMNLRRTPLVRVGRVAWGVIALASYLFGADTPCKCGPDFCHKDPRYARALAAKKDSMRKSEEHYPEELISLLDIDGECFARIERAPDIFTIKMVKPDGSWSTIPWTKQDEDLAKQEVASGKLREFYEFNVSKAFSCCGDLKFNERSDWDDKLELNFGLTIKCAKNGATVTCGRNH